MSLADYEYHGLKASTWDLWRGDTSKWSDRHFYLDIVREFGQPVLDVGCGTGRILLDYFAQGIDIDGVDNSPEMLASCREKASRLGLSPTLHEQSMETLALPRRYRTILVPSSSFTLITDPAAAHTTMGRFFTHLESGGAFITPFSPAKCSGEPLDDGWQITCQKVRPGDGAIVRIYSHNWQDSNGQLYHSEQRFEVELNGKIIDHQFVRRSPEGRCYTQAQAVELYRSVGFGRTELFDGFTRRPALEDCRLFSALGING